MNSDRLRLSTSAARSIITFCFRLARRLIVFPRPISCHSDLPFSRLE
jgi:hypothetical protein